MANVVGAAAGVVKYGIESSAADRLSLASAAYVAALVFQGVVVVVVATASQRVRRRLDGLLRERVMAALLEPSGIGQVEDPSMRPALDAARAAAPNGGMSPGTIAALLPSVLGNRIGLIARVAGLTYVFWPIGVAYAAVTIANQAAMHQALWRVAGAGGGVPPAAVAYQLELATSPAAAKEIRVFGLGDWIGRRYRDGMLGHVRTVWSQRRDFTPALIATLVVAATVNAVGLVVLGRAALDGRIGVGELAFAVSSLIALMPALNQDDMPFAFASATIQTIESAEIVARGLHARTGARSASALPVSSVQFSGVAFRYPGSDVDVLTSVDLDLRVGERTALVGLNGAGKTTLVKLLCGLYEPTAGTISVDGVPLQHFEMSSWRSQLAVLFQQYARYELSARDNVKFGAIRWRGPDADEAATRAAERAGASDVIMSLPGAWDSPLSAAYEGGSEISGGQWQRVALARCLFAVEAGARVLVLDEPTSNLDVRAETALFESLLALTSDASAPRIATVFISHRFSTVRQADRIVVLDAGRITEDGTHDELLARGGAYAQLFRTQAHSYVEETQ